MRIVYFGTPDFAIPPLKLLHQSTHEIISIVTSPDKKSGRGLSVRKSPVKKQGEKFSIPVLQPNDFN
ncbi:MAG: methionyl-tRNA formyltransferase, partial [Candidatus Neomarinimicrobiota bacterium]|nr:methionyl-tRNA formyltransferase [Candidatus Neomarinimicrobiota bacterium]